MEDLNPGLLTPGPVLVLTMVYSRYSLLEPQSRPQPSAWGAELKGRAAQVLTASGAWSQWFKLSSHPPGSQLCSSLGPLVLPVMMGRMTLTGSTEEDLWNQEKKGRFMEVSLEAWPASGVGLAMAMAAIGTETENHLGNGGCLCSLPPEKPEKACFKSKLLWNCSHSPLAHDLTSQQMTKPPGITLGCLPRTCGEHSPGAASAPRHVPGPLVGHGECRGG